MAPPADRGLDAAAWLRRIGRVLLLQPRWLAWLAPLAWAALIWRMSASTRTFVASSRLPEWLVSGIYDLAHPLVFGLLALLLVPLLPRTGAGDRRWIALDRRAAAIVLAVTVAYGVADEWHQSQVPGRSPSCLDVVSDAVGAAAVLSVVACLGPAGDVRAELRRRVMAGLGACILAAAASTAWSVVTDRAPWPG